MSGVDFLSTIISNELTKRSWQLANEPGFFHDGKNFVERVHARVEQWNCEKGWPIDEEHGRKAAVHEYCYLFHVAPRQSSRVQSQALKELLAYGWPLTLKLRNHPDLAEAAINKTLNTVWQKVEQIQDPGAFLAYFAQALRRELNRTLKETTLLAEQETTEADLPGGENGESGNLDPLEIAAASNRLGEATMAEMRQLYERSSLITKLHICLGDWKKTFCIVADFLLELSPEITAWILSAAVPDIQVNVNSVYGYKFRALRQLRTERCPDVIEELILLIEP